MGGWGGTWGSQPNIYGRNQGGFDAGRYFGNPTGLPAGFSEIYWQQNPDLAFRHAVRGEAAPDSHYGGWLAREQGRVLEDWAAQGLHNPSGLITDYLPGAMRNLATRYTQLPTWQQGQNPGSWWAGRRL